MRVLDGEVYMIYKEGLYTRETILKKEVYLVSLAWKVRLLWHLTLLLVSILASELIIEVVSS